jgi:hypothetical protein
MVKENRDNKFDNEEFNSLKREVVKSGKSEDKE